LFSIFATKDLISSRTQEQSPYSMGDTRPHSVPK